MLSNMRSSTLNRSSDADKSLEFKPTLTHDEGRPIVHGNGEGSEYAEGVLKEAEETTP
ncbi:MAG: hypothetical protein HOL29_03150 [Euryarchaeota archaeon]|jgi:hypothetical protein|nr:hypothetical protein [Euryarchaeota archaeon]